MFKFRDATQATGGFGRQITEALKRSASRSTAFKLGHKRVFLFDTDESLQGFGIALSRAQRKSDTYTLQGQNLQWALRQAHSMLLVVHGDAMHYMCSEDPEEFEEVLCRHRSVRQILKDFRGVSSPYTYGNLRLATT